MKNSSAAEEFFLFALQQDELHLQVLDLFLPDFLIFKGATSLQGSLD